MLNRWEGIVGFPLGSSVFCVKIELRVQFKIRRTGFMGIGTMVPSIQFMLFLCCVHLLLRDAVTLPMTEIAQRVIIPGLEEELVVEVWNGQTRFPRPRSKSGA